MADDDTFQVPDWMINDSPLFWWSEYEQRTHVDGNRDYEWNIPHQSNEQRREGYLMESELFDSVVWDRIYQNTQVEIDKVHAYLKKKWQQ